MKLKTKFEDEDFILGEVANVDIATMPDSRIKAQAEAKSGGIHTFFYDNLKMFMDEWEDYEELTGYWYIDFDGEILGCVEPFDGKTEECRKQIGNYFETRKEAEKAVEKLKAIIRLKDKGFKFDGFSDRDRGYINEITIYAKLDNLDDDTAKDLDLLFGDEVWLSSL